MAAEVPTFKLVLVGDGGTGKVSKSSLQGLFAVINIPYPTASKSLEPLLSGDLALNAANQRNCRPRSSSAI